MWIANLKGCYITIMCKDKISRDVQSTIHKYIFTDTSSWGQVGAVGLVVEH